MSSETASVHLSTYRCCWLADTNRFSRTDVKNKNLQICLKAKHLFPKRYRTVLAGFSCCTSSVISSVSDSSLFYSAALLKPLINNSSRLHSNRPGDGSSYSERECECFLTVLVQEELVEAQAARLFADEAVHVLRAVVVDGDGVFQRLHARLQTERDLGVADGVPEEEADVNHTGWNYSTVPNDIPYLISLWIQRSCISVCYEALWAAFLA